MTAKELLRERIEELSERIDEISEDEAASWLFALDDLAYTELQPLTPEQVAMIERGLADSDAGRVVPQDEVLRRLGIHR